MQGSFDAGAADAQAETGAPEDGTGDAAIHVTFFGDYAAKRYTTENLTLPQLQVRILEASARKKADLPWLKLAEFGKERSAKGSLRHDKNVVQITGCELDYDVEEISFDDAVKGVEQMGIEALLYTSASHTPEKPRWRILAPTSKACQPAVRAKLVARINGFMKAKLGVEVIAKSESFALSQSFYYGWVCDAPKPHHRAVVVKGGFIDLRDDLAEFESSGGPPAKDAGPGSTSNSSGDSTGNIDWAVVEKHIDWLKSTADLPANFSAKGRAVIAHSGNLKDLELDLAHAGMLLKPYQSWSEVAFAVAAIFKSDGRFSNEQIAAALMADLECNRHVNKIVDPAKKRRAIERLILRSHIQPQARKHAAGMPVWREQRKDGSPMPSMHNARLAMAALGIECSYNGFHNKLLFGFKDDSTQHVVEQFFGEVTDNGIIALRQLMSETFGFDLTDKHTRDAVVSLALERCFDPVADMLAEAEANWDRVKRLDLMAADYLNCEDTTLNAAYIRKTMIAAVARARIPGIKFDQITVLESGEGFNKSTAWRVLAGDENFSDESIIGKNSREVQEQLAEIWIHENADLAGMKKAEVETIKAYASRQIDIARPAYGHFVKKQKRHSIEVGTTNSQQYLQSQTGNRRFWSLKVLKSIDLDKLRQDRLQLWGEAARYQSQGESLVLDEKLWGEAGVQQEARRIPDPWEDILQEIPGVIAIREFKDGYHREKDVQVIHKEVEQERVSAPDLLEYILEIPPGSQRTEHSMRLSNAMKHLGWQRADNGYVTIGGKRVKGYFRPCAGTQ